MTELRAILEGVKLAMTFGGENIVIESDCLEAINLVLGNMEAQNETGTVVEEIGQLIPNF